MAIVLQEKSISAWSGHHKALLHYIYKHLPLTYENIQKPW